MFLQQKSNLCGMNEMSSYDMDLEIGKMNHLVYDIKYLIKYHLL